MAQSFSNNGLTTVASPYTAGDTTLVVGSAAAFPPSGDYTILIDNEYLLVTGGQGTDSWTVVGAQEGSAPSNHDAGATVAQEFTKAGLDSLGAGYWGNFEVAGDADTLSFPTWRGGTVSGPPPSGTAGDFVWDEGGHLWFCTATGTPGTWISISPDLTSRPLGKLGFAQDTSASGVGTSASTSPVHINGLAVTVTPTAGRLLKITAHAELKSTVSGDTGLLRIYEGVNGTELNQTGRAFIAGQDIGFDLSAIVAPTAASHQYTVSFLRASGAGTVSFDTSTARPAYILVEDIGLA